MNKYIVITIILIVSCFGACKKPNGPPLPAPPRVPDSVVIMTAMIDTSLWSADSVSGELIPYGNGNDSGRYDLSITAEGNGNLTVMNFYITNYFGAGIYNISPPFVSATFYKNSVRHFAISGQISITNDSTTDMQGVFNFIADSANGMNVTNGVFRFPL